MDLTATEIEGLFEEVGQRGVTLLIHIDHSRLAAGEDPWTLHISGTGARVGGGTHTSGTFQECLESGLRELRGGPGDWEWLDLYL